jgi:hypothetical protein
MTITQTKATDGTAVVRHPAGPPRTAIGAGDREQFDG